MNCNDCFIIYICLNYAVFELKTNLFEYFM